MKFVPACPEEEGALLRAFHSRKKHGRASFTLAVVFVMSDKVRTNFDFFNAVHDLLMSTDASIAPYKDYLARVLFQSYPSLWGSNQTARARFTTLFHNLHGNRALGCSEATRSAAAEAAFWLHMGPQNGKKSPLERLDDYIAHENPGSPLTVHLGACNIRRTALAAAAP